MNPTLRKLAEASYYLGAALVAVVAFRFAFVSIYPRTAGRDDAPKAETAPDAPRPARSAVDARPRDLPLGAPVRMRVVVTRGPDRAEVRINGGVLGNAPFVGETSCRVGESLVVELVPARGEAQRFERKCEAGVLRIE